MKRIIKSLLCAALICAVALPFYACDNGTMGVAYGLVHRAGYVGKATITKNGDKVINATLEEMCFPSQVTANSDVADADKVTVGEDTSAKSYYKTIKYGDVTMTFDAERNTYMVGNQSLEEYFQSEENCKAYFEAAASNQIMVTVGGEDRTDIMTKANLSKDENGYWTKQDADGNNYSRWKVNRDATVNYVKEYGIGGLNSLTQSSEAVKDKYGVDSKYWKDSDNVSTGATWTDMYSETTPSNYYTYSMLLLKAASDADSQNNNSGNA